MPRRRKKDRQARFATDTQLEPGDTVDSASVPKDILERFADDDESEQAVGAFPGSEFVNGAGQSLDTVTAAPQTGLPLPSVQADPPVAAADPTQNPLTEYRQVVPELRDLAAEDPITPQGPTKPQVAVEGARNYLSWIVTEVRVSSARTGNGQLTAEIVCKASLHAIRTKQIPVDAPGQSTKEPAIDAARLTAEPVELRLPIWCLPEAKQRRPDTLSMAEATAVLNSMFASMAFEVIPPAPLPRAFLALPKWAQQEMINRARGGQ